MEAIAEYVTMGGIIEMLLSCAVKWDSQDMVSQPSTSNHSHCYLCIFYTGAIAVDGSVFTGSTLTSFVSSVTCVGDEIDLFSCSLNLSSMVCDGEVKAGVACQGL